MPSHGLKLETELEDPGKLWRQLSNEIKDALAFQTLVTFEDTLNEFRGHLTEAILKGWILEQASSSSACYCALHYSQERRRLCAYIISRDLKFVYDVNGARCAVAFSVRTLDNKLAQCFKEQDLVLITLSGIEGGEDA